MTINIKVSVESWHIKG